MRFAYADPPYMKQAKKHYGKEAAAAGRVAREVNHPLLVQHLCDEYPDGWALSLSSPSLKHILPMCPDDVRVMAWVKPFAIFKPGVNPGYCWEPVLVRGGRKRGRDKPTVRDWVSCNITLKKGLVGVKPPPVCEWLFEVLGAEPGDVLDDIFPGSGAVTAAWDQWVAGQVDEARTLDLAA
jgi:hypothetical protein